ncbi:MAG: hypothetical protein RPR98_05315 [Bermanella sp.]
MSTLLDEYGVRPSFRSRLVAVLGTEPPKPPQTVLDEQLSNEYFAYFVLDAQDMKYTVRNAYELIGGGFNKVAANVRRVKPLLPMKEDASKEVDALSALKAEIRAAERRLLNIELQEQEDFYVNKLLQLERKYHEEHDDIIASNARLTTAQHMLEKDNETLKEQLLAQQARQQALNNDYSQAQSELRGTLAKQEGLQQLIDEQGRSLAALQAANTQTLSAYSSKLKALGDELDEYRITNKKLVNEISVQREALAGSNERLLQSTEQLEQQGIMLKEQSTLRAVRKTMDESLAALNPICELVEGLIEAKKAGAINVKSIVTAIHSVDGKVADVNSRVDAGLLQVLAALERESKPARDNKDE